MTTMILDKQPLHARITAAAELLFKKPPSERKLIIRTKPPMKVGDWYMCATGVKYREPAATKREEGVKRKRTTPTYDFALYTVPELPEDMTVELRNRMLGLEVNELIKAGNVFWCKWVAVEDLSEEITARCTNLTDKLCELIFKEKLIHCKKDTDSEMDELVREFVLPNNPDKSSIDNLVDILNVGTTLGLLEVVTRPNVQLTTEGTHLARLCALIETIKIDNRTVFNFNLVTANKDKAITIMMPSGPVTLVTINAPGNGRQLYIDPRGILYTQLSGAYVQLYTLEAMLLEAITCEVFSMIAPELGEFEELISERFPANGTWTVYNLTHCGLIMTAQRMGDYRLLQWEKDHGESFRNN